MRTSVGGCTDTVGMDEAGEDKLINGPALTDESPSTDTTSVAISPADRAILEFEQQHPRNDRRKEAAIRDAFGYSWVRYQQRLMQLTGDRDAVAAYPMVCARVLRISRRNGLRQAG